MPVRRRSYRKDTGPHGGFMLEKAHRRLPASSLSAASLNAGCRYGRSAVPWFEAQSLAVCDESPGVVRVALRVNDVRFAP
jgi:hypothetical protein